MKKYLLYIILLLSITTLFAQRPGFDKIKALKTAYITNQLDLTSAEAEKFWPVYNQYDKKLHKLTVIDRKNLQNDIVESGGIDALSTAEAKKLTDQITELRTSIYHAEQQKLEALQKVLSNKKILKLIGAEESFRRELLQRLREQRKKRF